MNPQSVLGDVSKSVRAGHTALLADVIEQSSEVIDTAMARLAGSVLRRSVDEVQAEIAAAEQAARAAAREARKELAAARREKTKEEIQAKLDELKARLRPHATRALD
jgi:class 3 adenylate cyclase